MFPKSISTRGVVIFSAVLSIILTEMYFASNNAYSYPFPVSTPHVNASSEESPLFLVPSNTVPSNPLKPDEPPDERDTSTFQSLTKEERDTSAVESPKEERDTSTASSLKEESDTSTFQSPTKGRDYAFNERARVESYERYFREKRGRDYLYGNDTLSVAHPNGILDIEAYCKTSCRAFFDCKGLRLSIEEGKKRRIILTQAPERADGVGARMWARIQVMVIAQAMGYNYVHVPIKEEVPIFGPTVGGQRYIDWERFLNLFEGYDLARDYSRKWTILNGELPPQEDIANLPPGFRVVDVSQLLSEGNITLSRKDKGFSLYAFGHGILFAEDECLKTHLDDTYTTISENLFRNYIRAKQPRPVCGYREDVLDVAVHIRRGDVLPGDPEKLMRCGKRLLSDRQIRDNPEKRNPFFSENFKKRGNEFSYYIGLMENILEVVKPFGVSLRFHLFSQTASACRESYKDDFPELEFLDEPPDNEDDSKSQRMLLRANVDGHPELTDLNVNLNSDPREAFHCLHRADVLVVAKSSFSLVAAMTGAPDQIRIKPPVHEEWEHSNGGGSSWISSKLDGQINRREFSRKLTELLSPGGLGIEAKPSDIIYKIDIVNASKIIGIPSPSIRTRVYYNFSKVNYWTGLDDTHNLPKCDEDNEDIRLLGHTQTAKECAAMCVNASLGSSTMGNPARRQSKCWGYTWFPKEHSRFESAVTNDMWLTRDRRCPYACFGLASPGAGSPDYTVGAVSGDLFWDCEDDTDCSHNGKCTHGKCVCRQGWEGIRCQRLAIRKAKRTGGYQAVLPATYHKPKTIKNKKYVYTAPGPLNESIRGELKSISSWGGTIIKGQDGKYHMWVSEISDHCGIIAWTWNSRVVHATSENPEGPYLRQKVLWPIFAHEPRVVPIPTKNRVKRVNKLVMFFTADLGRNASGRCACCREEGRCDGSTEDGDCPSKRKGGQDEVEETSSAYMSTAPSPVGPWSEPVLIGKGDNNFSPVIFEDGSLLSIIRSWRGEVYYGSHLCMFAVRNYRDAKSYRMSQKRCSPIFRGLGSAGLEDPFLYQDSQGVVHAIFHHMWASGSWNRWWSRTTGSHAFLKIRNPKPPRRPMETLAEYHMRAGTWVFTGLAYGNDTEVTHSSRRFRMRYVDGHTLPMSRVERPHLVFPEVLSHKGDPSHIAFAVQTGNGIGSTVESSHSHGKDHLDDKSHTVIVPLGVGEPETQEV